MNKPSTQSLLRKREIQFHAYIVKFQDDFFKMSDAKLSCRPAGCVEAAECGNCRQMGLFYLVYYVSIWQHCGVAH